MALLRNIATVGSFTLLSRITGFTRDILIATVMGAGTVTDAFFVAFKFPNLFRRLFAEGAFNVAFIPLLSGLMESAGARDARRFAREAMTALGIILTVLVIGMEIAMPWAIHLFAPGFDQVPGKMELATELSRITFPYLLFISLVSLLAGVLNTLGRFAAAAAAPVLLNLTLIVALLGFGHHTETPGHALAWGVSAAGVIQLAWLLIAARRAGMSVLPCRPRLSPEVKTLVKRLIPGAVGVGVYQINLLVDTILASLVADGAVSYLYYADRVTQLPLGVVGIAVGTALLPLLSRQLKAGEWEAAQSSQNRSLELTLLLTVPAAAAFLVIAGPIVSVLFRHGAFTLADADNTARALMAFSAGLPAFVLIKVLAPGFYARGDTATPVKVAVGALIANVVLNLILMGPLGHVGIALATAISSWLNAAALAFLLKRRALLHTDSRLRARLPRIVLSAGVMAGALYGLGLLLDPWLAGPILERALALAALVAAGIVVYFAACQITGAARLAEIKAMMRRSAPRES